MAELLDAVQWVEMACWRAVVTHCACGQQPGVTLSRIEFYDPIAYSALTISTDGHRQLCKTWDGAVSLMEV